MPVITITGLYGAGRDHVGRLVAQRLGAELVDRKIFEEVSRRLDLPPEEVEEQEEAPASLLDRVLRALGSASVEFSSPPDAIAWQPPHGEMGLDTRQAVLHVTQEVIGEAARTRNAVIVGRGAAFLLAEEDGALHVFLHGSEEDRLAAVMGESGQKEEAAKSVLKATDANRSAYAKQVYSRDWYDLRHYHLTIDSNRLGWMRTAEIILSAAR